MTVASPGNPSVAVKIDGTTIYDWEPGQWFACRVNSPTAPKVADSSGGRLRSDQKPTLLFELEDDDGNPVELHSEARVEVDSEALGRHIFELTAEPNLFRKKESLLLGEVTIARLVDDWPTGLPHPGTLSMGLVGAGAAGQVSESGSSPVTVSEDGSGSVV